MSVVGKSLREKAVGCEFGSGWRWQCCSQPPLSTKGMTNFPPPKTFEGGVENFEGNSQSSKGFFSFPISVQAGKIKTKSYSNLEISNYPDKVEAFEIVFVPPGKAPGIPLTIFQPFSESLSKTLRFDSLVETIICDSSIVILH